jgi:hypothetical protein
MDHDESLVEEEAQAKGSSNTGLRIVARMSKNGSQVSSRMLRKWSVMQWIFRTQQSGAETNRIIHSEMVVAKHSKDHQDAGVLGQVENRTPLLTASGVSCRLET